MSLSIPVPYMRRNLRAEPLLLPLPSRERVGVRVAECLCNPLQDRLSILPHLIVPKAQYAVAMLCQKSSPPPIRLRLRDMLPTI